MSSIQQAFNQAAQVGSLLYTQTPGFEEKKLSVKEGKEYQRLLNDQAEAMKRGDTGAEQEINKSIQELAKHSVNPEVRKAQKFSTPSDDLERKVYESPTATFYDPVSQMKEAFAKMRVKQQQQMAQKSRRNFMADYLSKQPTSLGGTVGDLPIDLQQKIASQYSKSQRNRLMNAMDKEQK